MGKIIIFLYKAHLMIFSPQFTLLLEHIFLPHHIFKGIIYQFKTVEITGLVVR